MSRPFRGFPNGLKLGRMSTARNLTKRIDHYNDMEWARSFELKQHVHIRRHTFDAKFDVFVGGIIVGGRAYWNRKFIDDMKATMLADPEFDFRSLLDTWMRSNGRSGGV